MKKLIDKHIDGKLTPEEIETTREWLSTHSDSQLDRPMYESWSDFEPAKEDCDAELEQRVYRRLTGEFAGKRRTPVWKTVARIAAVLVFGVLACGVVALYNANSRIKDQMLSAATLAGQQATLTLPDGSTVNINGQSTVSYRAEDFAGDRRMVRFDGEGFFDIARQEGAEFVIDTDDLTVTVRGTSFNLASRRDAAESSIHLISGNVELTSKLSGTSVELHENEKAVLNRATGQITVENIDVNDNPGAWLKHRLVFEGATFGQVVKQVEDNYGVEIECPAEQPAETFTGMIPLDNLDVATEIIEGTFHTGITVTK